MLRRVSDEEYVAASFGMEAVAGCLSRHDEHLVLQQFRKDLSTLATWASDTVEQRDIYRRKLIELRDRADELYAEDQDIDPRLELLLYQVREMNLGDL